MKYSATTLLFTILVVILCQLSQALPEGGHSGPANGEPNGPGSGRRCRYNFDREEWTCTDNGRTRWCVPGRDKEC
ncbi:hypothetical protein BKA69DRAFT_1071948 [Paraphysoderma sedebokerense]|nr:hypothetical protein BKA69DRAFT_1071948 [Paraphysoderma sedebokerense]